MDPEPRPETTPESAPAFNGWWYVLFTLIPAVVLHEYWTALDRDLVRYAQRLGLFAADCLIFLRAVFGLAGGERTRWWVAYCALLILLPFIADWIIGWAWQT